ncbi:Anaerobic nitric oxide reductase transcription regulator NorR [Pleomorphomonas sp. T1.2MG-36]|nr:Anaerobic nitric oxide reductase transcription regulator NorR [Pleomorphomonas sp. T1.2MG-36]
MLADGEETMVIAFIAPHERISIAAQSIVEASGYPAKVYLGDLQQGVRAARQAMAEGAKIFISRGGTARLIRQELGVEVIEVEASVQRTLAYVYKETSETTRIAVAGFEPLINLVAPVCDVLGRTYRSFELREKASFQTQMDRIGKWGPDVVIGDAIAYHWAQARGLDAYLIESSLETLLDAFERAMLVYNNLCRYILAEEKLATVLNCSREGAILINREGVIEEINRQGCDILSQPRDELIGALLSDYFDNAELNRAFRKNQTARNMLVNYRDEKLALDHITVSADNATGGASVILFQPVQKIQDTGNVIRRKLADSGFYAKYTFDDIFFASEKMRQLVAVAKQYSQTDSNIMIVGETGTGKELFAQSIHNAGPLAKGPFVAVNCAALPGALLESELFGYAPGAFTGASRSGKIGLFELAHEGTLFLDELTEMDFFLQSKLLRALQTQEIMRVGGNKIIPIKVRIIATTNRKPLEEIHEGRLRADLFYRLNTLDLKIPPLRERENDPEQLFARFLAKKCERRGIPVPTVPEKILAMLRRYAWPGNVRELENLAEKYATLHTLSPFDMPLISEFATIGMAGADDEDDAEATLEDFIAAKVAKVFRVENGNVTRTAQRLGIDRNTVKRWLEKVPDKTPA